MTDLNSKLDEILIPDGMLKVYKGKDIDDLKQQILALINSEREQVYQDFIKEIDGLIKADMNAVEVVNELTRALKRVVINSPLLKSRRDGK